MEIELERRLCVGEKCHGTFSVMPNDPQKWCSKRCKDQHESNGWKKKNQAFLKIPREIRTANPSLCTQDHGEPPKGLPNEEQETLIDAETLITAVRNVANREKNITVPQRKKKKLKENGPENITIKTEKNLMNKDQSEEKKHRSTQMNNNEEDTTKTEPNSLQKSQQGDTAMTRQGDLPNLLQISEQVKLTSMNLIDDAASHLLESMKSMNTLVKGKGITVVDTVGSEIERMNTSCAIASQIKGLMSLKLETIKACHVINKEIRQ